jgi:hypothetical protein
LSHAQQPKPLPPLEAKHAPTGKGAASKRKGEMFRQHADFVTQWHRVLRSRDVQTVWHYLWSIAHRDGRWMYVGAERIAVQTGVHERTVKRCVQQLERRQLLDVQRPAKAGRGIALGFRIPAELPKPAERVADVPPIAAGKGGV